MTTDLHAPSAPSAPPAIPAPSDIRSLRAQYGLSRAQFARQCNIPLRTIEAWEQGRRRMPRIIWHHVLLTLTLGRAMRALRAGRPAG